MKQRVPGYVFIPLVMITVIGMFYAIRPDMSIFKSTFVWVILFLSFILALILNSLNKTIEGIKFKKLSPEQQANYLAEKKKGYISSLIHSAKNRQTQEEEDDIILDHGYDGIKELDNSLPQWWLSMFYLGIIVCVVYMLSYAFTDFAHPEIEYVKQNEEMDKEIEEYIKTLPEITVETAENKYDDPQAIANGKKIYGDVCATCHQANGGGGIGPNLTDDYWINIEQDSLYKNIYYVAYNGSKNNPTMRAFGAEGEIHPYKLQDVASYIYYLNQVEKDVTPAEGGATPQGDIAPWVEGASPQTGAKQNSAETGE